jgi:hypothetical protein
MPDIFHIVPAARSPWVLVAIGFVPLAAMLLVGVLLSKAFTGGRASTFEVSAAGLRLRGDMYGLAVPVSHLRVADARTPDKRASVSPRHLFAQGQARFVQPRLFFRSYPE